MSWPSRVAHHHPRCVASIKGTLAGSGMFERLYPDWRAAQRSAVAAACAELPTWVADADGVVAGFGAVRLDAHAGIGTRLTEFALARLREAGLAVAMVETGGDAGHGPARRTYERAGFTALPIVRYFRTP